MEVYAQIFSLAATVAIGMLLGSIFDFYRVFRSLARMGKGMTIFWDAVYWLIAVAVTFACLLYSNWAQMRFYIFFGILGGAVFYYKCVSQYVLILFLRVFHLAISVNAKMRKGMMTFIVKPLGYFLGILSFPFRYGKNKAGQMGGKLKRKLKMPADTTKK